MATGSDAPQAAAPETPARGRGRLLGYVASHPAGVAQGLAYALLAVVILQNLEPTSIDLLFWSIPDIPKLVLILVAMLLGGVTWEVLRRMLFRRR